MAITHLPAGYLSDRFGRRPMIYAAWTVGVVAAWIMALSNSLTVFVAGAVMYGFTGFVMTPLNSYITAARGTQSVGRALTLISATFSFGAILGPWLGGEIGERFGLRTNFLVAACFFVASTLIILFIKPQPVEAVEKQSSSLPANSWLNARFVLFLGLIFLSVFSMMLPQPFSQLFLLNERDISLNQLGRLISLEQPGCSPVESHLRQAKPSHWLLNFPGSHGSCLHSSCLEATIFFGFLWDIFSWAVTAQLAHLPQLKAGNWYRLPTWEWPTV